MRPSAVRLQGDSYQHLYSWYEALQLLDEDSAYEHAIVEHPQAGSADDVTIHPKEGFSEPSRYVQVKWHTDQRAGYSFAKLMESGGPGERSLLKKLFDSWRGLPKDGAIEVWLVSNWSADPETLGRFLKDRYSLAASFFDGGSKSLAGRARKLWQDHVEAQDEAELIAFCHDLRLGLGLGSPLLEKMVDDAMRGHGLRTGKNARDSAVAEVADWVKEEPEPKPIGRAKLLEAIKRRDLKAVKIEEPKVCLWVHGWSQEHFSHPATVERNWCTHFDYGTKRLPDQRTWEEQLSPDLQQAAQEVTQKGREKLVDVRGKLPLTIALAVGSAFPKTLGYTLRIEQPSRATNTTELWRSDASPTPGCKLIDESICKPTWKSEGDLLLALCLTVDATPAIKDLVKQGFFGDLRAAFVAKPSAAPGQGSLRGERDACALATATKELLQKVRNQYKHRRIHLVPIAPAGFCLFLGQHLTGVGEIVTYERIGQVDYQRSITLKGG